MPAVPPAPPACQLRGSPTVGANVTLSCASEKGKPSPAYQWQRMAPTLQVFFPPAQGKVGLGVGGSFGGGERWRGWDRPLNSACSQPCCAKGGGE